MMHECLCHGFYISDKRVMIHGQNGYLVFFLQKNTLFIMSKRDTRRDTIVEHYPLVEGQQQVDIQRVVVISIDPNSAKYVIDWAVDNFIQPSKDLVSTISDQTKALILIGCDV